MALCIGSDQPCALAGADHEHGPIVAPTELWWSTKPFRGQEAWTPGERRPARWSHHIERRASTRRSKPTIPSLVRALTAACGDAEVAADSVQEASWVKAHLRWRQISRYDDPVAWVRRVAIHKMRDHFRREERASKARRLLAAELVWAVEAPASDMTRQRCSRLCLHGSAWRCRCTTSKGCRSQRSRAAMSLSGGRVKFHMSQGSARLRPAAIGARDG